MCDDIRDNLYACGNGTCAVVWGDLTKGKYVDPNCKVPVQNRAQAGGSCGSQAGGSCSPAGYNFFQPLGNPLCLFSGISPNRPPPSPAGSFYQGVCCSGQDSFAVKPMYSCINGECKYVGTNHGTYADPNCGGQCPYNPADLRYKCHNGQCVQTEPGKGQFLDNTCGGQNVCQFLANNGGAPR